MQGRIPTDASLGRSSSKGMLSQTLDTRQAPKESTHTTTIEAVRVAPFPGIVVVNDKTKDYEVVPNTRLL